MPRLLPRLSACRVTALICALTGSLGTAQTSAPPARSAPASPAKQSAIAWLDQNADTFKRVNRNIWT